MPLKVFYQIKIDDTYKKISCCIHMYNIWKYVLYDSLVQYLRIEFYLFASHEGMNDRGSRCKFCNARSAFRNLHVDPLSFIPP